MCSLSARGKVSLGERYKKYCSCVYKRNNSEANFLVACLARRTLR
jgi:hypothetical protein